ncbi:MAG TPA: M13 family metallopeptidase, partial [Longimicrobiales bacterium]|nr:M13 family metallopeptidase [Longimicrobiales bacterium]
KIGDFYAAFMDEARIETLGLKPLEPTLAEIAKISSTKELSAAFAKLGKVGARAPFRIGVGQDPKNATVYAVLGGQAGLGLADREYYLRTDGKFPSIRQSYAEYITKVMTLANQPDPAGAAQRIVALETQLAEKQWDRAKSRNRDLTYNKMTLTQLQAATPNVDWKAYLAAAGGAKTASVNDVVISQPDYMQAMDAILAATPVSTWKEYLTFSLINAYADDLPKAFVDAQFDFNGRVLSGQKEMRARWKRGVSETEGVLGEPIGKLYVEKYFTPAAKARMLELVNNLLAAFKVGIDSLEWMSPETKAEAQKKLAKYTVKIGYPDRWRDYSALDIQPNDLIGNLMRSRLFASAESWGRLGTPVEKWRWGMTAQTVNASYNPANNEITFPAAILQPPFFNMSADDAVNYGGIGSVIGHEISHGFDDQGRKSDGDGNLRDWWTADDAKKFEERAVKLGAEYEAVSLLPGMKINGRQTMGENIGDLSGMAVALRAYHMSLKGKQAPVIDGFTGDQRFFMGWAQVWRFKTRDEALRNQLLTDSHSPGMVRSYLPMTNIDAWYNAFGVKPGDKLYKAPEERVKIW